MTLRPDPLFHEQKLHRPAEPILEVLAQQLRRFDPADVRWRRRSGSVRGLLPRAIRQQAAVP